MMLFVSFLIGEQLDSETIPLFICLMISMLLFMSEGLVRLKRRYK